MQCNQFTSHEQCKFHVDKRNVGDSYLAILGDCEGGALRLADGRHVARKCCWHVYNGAEVGHEVEPFVGERITLIAFNEPELPQQESFQTSACKRREGKA